MLSVPGAAQRPPVHWPETPARAREGVRRPAGRVHAGCDGQVSAPVCPLEGSLLRESVTEVSTGFSRYTNKRQEMHAFLCGLKIPT